MASHSGSKRSRSAFEGSEDEGHGVLSKVSTADLLWELRRRQEKERSAISYSDFPELRTSSPVLQPSSSQKQRRIHLAIDFNDVLGGSRFPRGEIPAEYQFPLDRLLQAGFDLNVLSYAGSVRRRDAVLEECMRFQRKYFGEMGRLWSDVVVCNQRLGQPFHHDQFGVTTGGKDFMCWKNNYKVLVDDCEGNVDAVEACGVMGYRIKVPLELKHNADSHIGKARVYSDFPQAVLAILRHFELPADRERLFQLQICKPEQDSQSKFDVRGSGSGEKRICRSFQAGDCRWGDRCKFQH